MTNNKFLTSIFLASMLIAPLFARAASLPRSFREWRHVKSMVITDEKSGLYGFHNAYANPNAVKGIGKASYDNGAEFVVSFYKVVKSDANIEQGAKLMDVSMKKDGKSQATGGWTFAAFGPDGAAKKINPIVDCFACHQAVKGADYIFSKYID